MAVDGLTPDEVFDTNHDYDAARHEREHPRHPTLNAVGRVALLFASNQESAQKIQEKFSATVTWFKNKVGEWNQKRLDEKAKRKDYGTFDVVGDIAGQPSVNDSQYEPVAPAHPVGERTGVYHSNFSKEPPQPDPGLSQSEMDDIMHGAVTRARASLGQLPLIHALAPLQNPNAPLPKRRPQTPADKFSHSSVGGEPKDDALYERLETFVNRDTPPENEPAAPTWVAGRPAPEKRAEFPNPEEELPKRREAKSARAVPIRPPDTDEDLIARLRANFGGAGNPTTISGSSNGRPHLHHERLPGAGKHRNKDLDSTNA